MIQKLCVMDLSTNVTSILSANAKITKLTNSDDEKVISLSKT